MRFIDNILSRVGYTRFKNGSHFYNKQGTNFLENEDLMPLARKNPVVSACIEIRARILSQADFYIEDASGERVDNDPVINLLNNPNPHQSKQDFIKQFEWFTSVYGWVYQRPFGSVGFSTDAIYNLKSSCIKFPDKMLDPYVWSNKEKDAYFEQNFNYSVNDKQKSYELKSIIPFYDLTNGLTNEKDSYITGTSRLKSILKQISNIELAADAENIMVQTNGREMFSGGTTKGELSSSIPLNPKDKENIENRLMNNYGFGFGKKRSVATQNMVDWKSLHIKLSDLGLHESIENNANLVRGAFDVPNELYNAYMEGATFENQKEALIGFIQNTIQPIADDLANSWTSHFGYEDKPIKASFSHLPVMQHAEDKKADKLLKIAMAYEKLTKADLNPEQINELFTSQGVNINNEG